MSGMASHVEFHASKPDETLPFYRELLGYFGWTVAGEWPGGLGMGDGQVSLWFTATPEGHRTPLDRDATGAGHVGIKVDSRADVDTFVREYLEAHAIAPQFETPRAREDFGPTYYQVMFLDPEGMPVEVFTA